MSFDFFDPAMLLTQADTFKMVDVSPPDVLVLLDIRAVDEPSPSFDELFAYSGAGGQAMTLAYDDPRILMPMDGEGSVDDGSGGVIITGPSKDPYLGHEHDGTGTGSGTGGEGTGGSGGGGSGGSGSGYAEPAADHTADCNTESGAAVQVAKHVMGIPPGAGPPNPIYTNTSGDWTTREFGAIIVKNVDGSFGAFNDKIYSNDSDGFVIYPSAAGTQAVGIWHNHPADPYKNAQADAVNAYPSFFPNGTGDWSALAKFKTQVASGNANFDPSLWLTGPDGVTRVFRLSERAFYEALSKEQMEAKTALEGKERANSCS